MSSSATEAYFIAGTRVSLDSVVYAFLRGESPEGIAESFPALDLENIFGALAFYMANREGVDRYLREGQQEFEAMRQQARRNKPALCAKLADSRRGSHPAHEAAVPGGWRFQPQNRSWPSPQGAVSRFPERS